MSLTASRVTAFLAALAMAGVAGTFWWAIQTRSEMRAAAANRPDRPLPAKFTGHAGRAAADRIAARDTGKDAGTGRFELAGHSTPLADEAAGAAPASEASASTRLRGLDLPGSQVATLPGGRANMPLPAMPPPAQPDPAPVPAKFMEPSPAFAAAAPPPQPDAGRRHARASIARASVAPAPAPAPSAASSAPKRPSSYMEKYFELGEYHYRRRPCEPPNMPDVCFMPQTDRQPIVVVSKP